MTAPSANLQIRVNGAGSWLEGGQGGLSIGASIEFRNDPSEDAGVTSRRFEIYDYPPGFTVPGGWTDDDGTYFSTASSPTAVVLSAWGKYLLRLIVNGGTKSVVVGNTVQEQAFPDYTDEETALSIASTGIGLHDLAAQEATQFSAQGWAGQHKVNLRTLDALIVSFTGGSFKQPVRAATTANITLSAPQTIDGVSVIAGDRVLVKNQSSGAENGIYVVAAGAWTRATDADTSAELAPATIVPVAEGTANADTLFILATNAPITLGVTALTFTGYGSAVGGGWTDDGSVVRLTTTADNVAIGATTMSGAEKLRVVGATRIEGQTLVTTGGLVVNGTAPVGSEALRVAGTSRLEGQVLITAGSLVVNGTALSGSEELRVVGQARVEGETVVTTGGLRVNGTAAILSEALTVTGSVLIDGVNCEFSSTSGNSTFGKSTRLVTGTAADTHFTGQPLNSGLASSVAGAGKFHGGNVIGTTSTATGGEGIFSGGVGGGVGGKTSIKCAASNSGGTGVNDGVIQFQDGDVSNIFGTMRKLADRANIFWWNDGTANEQTMDKGMYVGNCDVAPTGNPSGGGFLYSESGALKWRGSGGTTTTLGAAEPHCPVCERDFVVEYSHDDYGDLTLCMWCLSEALDDMRAAKGEFVMKKQSGRLAAERPQV